MRSQRNCWCGQIATTNCVKCGFGVCRPHLQDQGPMSITVKWADPQVPCQTLEEAAIKKGFWKAPQDRFICANCREQDAGAELARAKRLSEGWPRGPMRFAVAAIRHGYVYEDYGLTCDRIVEIWLRSRVKPAPVQATWQVRPARHKRGLLGGGKTIPAEFTQQQVRGWIFARTVAGVVSEYDGCVRVGWIHPTILMADGRMIQNRRLVPRPYEQQPDMATSRILVEMARFICNARGIEWNGPPEVW